MKHVVCNLCGADDARLLFTAPDREVPGDPQPYAVCQCRRCGLIYLNPRPDTAEEMARIYPPEYESYMGDDQRLVVALRRLAWLPEVREIKRVTTAQSRILEIGCATGEFLAGLRRAGRPYVQGLEFSAAAAAIARQRHGIDVRVGDLLDAGLPPDTYDIVIMRHVLEHVSDPRATLREIRRLLAPGGYCVFTIPNADSHTVRIFGADWYGWKQPRHFHTFSQRALTLMLRLTDLQLVEMKHSALPNIWIGSTRYWLESHGFRRVARLVRYQNPLALALFAPLGLASAALKSSGVIRVIVRRPLELPAEKRGREFKSQNRHYADCISTPLS